jgi:hypothetical protein
VWEASSSESVLDRGGTCRDLDELLKSRGDAKGFARGVLASVTARALSQAAQLLGHSVQPRVVSNVDAAASQLAALAAVSSGESDAKKVRCANCECDCSWSQQPGSCGKADDSCCWTCCCGPTKD